MGISLRFASRSNHKAQTSRHPPGRSAGVLLLRLERAASSRPVLRTGRRVRPLPAPTPGRPASRRAAHARPGPARPARPVSLEPPRKQLLTGPLVNRSTRTSATLTTVVSMGPAGSSRSGPYQPGPDGVAPGHPSRGDRVGQGYFHSTRTSSWTPSGAVCANAESTLVHIAPRVRGRPRPPPKWSGSRMNSNVSYRPGSTGTRTPTRREPEQGRQGGWVAHSRHERVDALHLEGQQVVHGAGVDAAVPRDGELVEQGDSRTSDVVEQGVDGVLARQAPRRGRSTSRPVWSTRGAGSYPWAAVQRAACARWTSANAGAGG